jgi:hypothetical protein
VSPRPSSQSAFPSIALPTERPNLLGQHGRLFADPSPTPDETSFQVDNTSAQYYTSPYYLLHKNQLQAVPAPATTPPRVNLVDILGNAVLAPIVAANKISFHAVGDTGAAKGAAHTAIAHEAGVADSMAQDVRAGGTTAPAFFFHLGDVIYNFGEAQYYYDQFYEPFRAYDRPIFAIPGNHDGAVFGSGTEVPQIPTLTAFLRNFCATTPGESPDAGGLVRTTMTQPGVYFTLDAPFVSIIGLYTNVLEGPGVISSQGGRYPIGDEQVQFLTAELTRLKPDRDAGKRAVLLACHHPPASVDAKHGGTTGLADDIDRACRGTGLWPDAILSGHAHLYQRYTRAVDGRQIPYVVAGSGGFSATPPKSSFPATPVTVGEYTLVGPPIVAFGYLLLDVDMAAHRLTIDFHSHDRTMLHDSVTVNLQTHKLVRTRRR